MLLSRLPRPEPATAASLTPSPAPPFPTETICDSRNVYQPGTNGVNHKLGSLVNSERIHNVGAMNGNRVGTEIEHRSNFPVGLAIHNHLQDFKFARSQPVVTLAFERRLLLHLGIKNRFSARDAPHRRP